MDDTLFEELERLNVQVDVWIDQEEFDRVISSFKFPPADKESADDDFEKRLENAFSHEYCTDDLDKEWDNLLNISHTPLIQFRLPNNDWKPFPKGDHEQLGKKWVWFFWAKLIRAKIQQKGSDCYFSRLDQVVVFLERNQPVIKRNSDKINNLSDQVNKLVVIYLLEMAAAGEGADQRSFAERARRILREHFKTKSVETICFYGFYDLLARYTIGVGFQHEGRGRKAVLEFNWIIKYLGELWNKDGNPAPMLFDDNPSKIEDSSEDVSAFKWTKKYLFELRKEKGNHDSNLLKEWAKYLDKRCGLEYLYLPAVLVRAGIEIKLQLAYHSLETLENYWKKPKNYYLEARRALLRAESSRLMDEHETSKEQLEAVAIILIEKCHTNPSLSGELPTEWIDKFKQINTVCRRKWANIQDRLLDTYVALRLDKLKEEPRSAQSESSEPICEIFSMYWQASQWQATDRTGYLQSVAAYLSWIAGGKNSDNDGANQFDRIAEELYKKNNEYLIPEKQDDEGKKKPPACLCCTKLKIKLERMGASHYQDFVKNMQKFFYKFKKNFDLEKDADSFQKQLFDVEQDHREDSAYQKREMAMNHLGNSVPRDWCKKCLSETTNSWLVSFSGLLNCVASHEKKRNNNQSEQREAPSLDGKHYEHLMDNWDRRFRSHLENVSVHVPRCNALHLLGLQRWNSTSPAIGRSLGGGYLIYHTNEKGYVDLGVAVDPGFDFVRNLFHAGFSLSDIDVVLLSHAHLDHIRDFESLVTLCLELKKRTRGKAKRRLHTIMTLGVYRRLSHIFASPGLREFVEPYILDIVKEIIPNFIEPYIDKLEYYEPFLKPNGNNHKPVINQNSQFVFQEKLPRNGGANTDRGYSRFSATPPSKSNNDEGLRLSIAATRAYHNDFSEYSDSFGFKIKISATGREADAYTIGYTGDTSWSPDIIDQYKDCDALLVHIGSLIDREKKTRFDKYDKKGKECWNLIKEKNHPYLFGLLRFLTEIADPNFTGKVPLVLLSEFGEELRGRIRLDLYERLKRAYSNEENPQKNIPLLPLDVGLDVILRFDESTDKSKSEKECSLLREVPKENKPSFWVKCVSCEEFIIPQQVDFETYGQDEALYCVCQTCCRSTPHNVLQDKLRDLYEVARPLQSY